MIQRHPQRDRATHRIAENVCNGHIERIECRRHVGGHRIETHRTIDVRGVAVSLKLEGNHAARGSQAR